jgi:hypothetical protein
MQAGEVVVVNGITKGMKDVGKAKTRKEKAAEMKK